MWRATWTSLWSRKIRLLLSTFAIVLGVAFVAGSLVFTATLDRAFQGIMTGSVSDVVVQPKGAGDEGVSSATVPAATLERVRAVPGVQRVEPEISSFGTFVLDGKGKVVGGSGPPGISVVYHDAPAAHGVRGLRVTEGHAPTGRDEVALDPRTAERAGKKVGDEVSFVTTSPKTPRATAKLVGLVSFADGSGLAGASLTVWDVKTAAAMYQTKPDTYTSLWVVTEPGADRQQVADAIAKVVPAGIESRTGDSVAEENSNALQEALGFITTFLLIFAGVALVVGSFLIVNTFSILVAQRSRELALLRALGATRRQVTRSVLLEAVVVGLVGSTAGLLLGFLLAMGIRTLFGRFGLDLSGTPLQFTPTAVIASYAVGMLVTMVAAYLPARRASRIAPVAALRDDVAMPEGVVLRRALLGILAIVVGVAAEVWVLTGERAFDTVILGLGLLLIVLGAVLACPIIGRPVVRGLGFLFRRVFGEVGNLAEQNAVRQPRRTAATASALMIGLSLVSMMSVFGASANASIDETIDKNFQGDYVISGSFGSPFSAALAQQARSVPGVATVAASSFASAAVDGASTGVLGLDPKAMGAVTTLTATSGSLSSLTDSTAVLTQKFADEKKLRVGDRLRLEVGGKTTRPQVVAIAEDSPALGPVSLTRAGFIAAGGPQQDNFLFVKRVPGADAAQVRAGLQKVADANPMVTLKDQEGYKAEQRDAVNQMLLLIYALLGLAVVIAILGIVNTLALSVIERTREIGLLRAVGLSRRQLRRMVRLESVTIAVLGAVLGVVIGVGFGIVLQRSQADNGISSLAIPWGRLGLFVLLAAIVGVLAAWFPARRAARLDVLRAIATE